MCHLFSGRVISGVVSDDLADLSAGVLPSDEWHCAVSWKTKQTDITAMK